MKKEELIAFVIEDAGLEKDEFDENTLLFSEGYIDSFTMTSMIAYIEEEAKVKIEPSAITLENFDSISRIVTYLGALNV